MHQFNEHHPELKGFSAYFDKELAPLLAGRDGDRKRDLKKVKLYGAIIIGMGLISYVIAFLIGQFGDAVFGITMITAIVVFGMQHVVLKEVTRFAKQQIVGGICEYVGWTFEEKPIEFPDMKAWADLGLVKSGYRAPLPINQKAEKQWDLIAESKSFSELKENIFGLKTALSKPVSDGLNKDSVRAAAKDIKSAMSGRLADMEDRIAGRAHGVEFNSIEAKLERKSGKTTITDFHGQLISMTFPRKFLGKTVVLRDKGRFQKKKLGDMKRVGLVDPIFEDIFEAYGTDQVEARYLLDPVFMEKLMELEKSVLGHNIRFGFADSQLLIAVDTGNRFEAGSMRHSLMDTNRTQRLLNEIGAIYDVVDGVMEKPKR